MPPQPPAEGDFEAIYETVRQSARGRWFLDEYARRNRNADTNLVLAAIERIETVVRDSRDREAYQSVRGDLLEMARTIAVTRAEVAEIKPEARAEGKPASERRAAPEGSDVFATAERIQDVAWTMRERGFDPRTCEQIETLAKSILSASALRDPNDHRTGKLGEVLQYLEQRIDRMLEAWAEGAQAFTPPAAATEETSPEGAPAHAGNGHDDDAGAVLADAAMSTALEIEPLAVVPLPAAAADAGTRSVELTLDPMAVAPAPVAKAAEPAAAAKASPSGIDARSCRSAPLTPKSDQSDFGHAMSDRARVDPSSVAREEREQTEPAARLRINFTETRSRREAAASATLRQPPPASTDPLAALRAMSDEERIALFT